MCEIPTHTHPIPYFGRAKSVNCPILVKEYENDREIYDGQYSFFKEKPKEEILKTMPVIKKIVGFRMEKGPNSELIPHCLVKLIGFPSKIVLKQPLMECPTEMRKKFEKMFMQSKKRIEDELDTSDDDEYSEEPFTAKNDLTIFPKCILDVLKNSNVPLRSRQVRDKMMEGKNSGKYKFKDTMNVKDQTPPMLSRLFKKKKISREGEKLKYKYFISL